MTRSIAVVLGLLASLTAPKGRHHTESYSGPYSGETIVRWNDNAVAVLSGAPPDRFTRDLAMVHLAAHDAANSVRPEFATYALDPRSLRHPQTADPALAAAAAAHDVLVALWPDKQAQIDLMLEKDTEAAKPGVRDRSREVGAAAAHAILTARANDGVDAVVPYTFGPPKPGVYQPVPPLGAIVIGNQVPLMTPFVIDSATRFRPAAPPELKSPEWARDYNEVKAYGRADSTVRTADQTDAARFFFELANLQWNRCARQVATRYDKGLWTTGRAFALINVSLMDDAIAMLDSKYHYNFWRPFTAIRASDDGNVETEPDPTWTPLGVTPPHPEYVAGHSSMSAAASVALTAIYGPRVAFRTTSTTTQSVRSYDSFDDMVVEIASSRVWAGLHYRSSVEVGMAQGYDVGRYVMANALRRTSADSR